MCYYIIQCSLDQHLPGGTVARQPTVPLTAHVTLSDWIPTSDVTAVTMTTPVHSLHWQGS